MFRRGLNYVRIPTSLGSPSVTMVLSSGNGSAAFRLWVNILQLWGSQDRAHRKGGYLWSGENGKLAEDVELARLIGMTPRGFRRAVEVIVKVGWLLRLDSSTDNPCNYGAIPENETENENDIPEEDVNQTELVSEERAKDWLWKQCEEAAHILGTRKTERNEYQKRVGVVAKLFHYLIKAHRPGVGEDQVSKALELLRQKYKSKARNHFAVFHAEVNHRWPGWQKGTKR